MDLRVLPQLFKDMGRLRRTRGDHHRLYYRGGGNVHLLRIEETLVNYRTKCLIWDALLQLHVSPWILLYSMCTQCAHRGEG